ncbi:hypothetical protein FHT44_005197 [Mycolicibacterium sp. BK634]|nr:hypothetical protein [Mycolicibacterium sp. BK634]
MNLFQASAPELWEVIEGQAKALRSIRELAEKWRYKGEFGWGPWQEGYGPDHEGYVLDCVSYELRQILDQAPKPWPGYCQTCKAVLDPPNSTSCRACSADDIDD